MSGVALLPLSRFSAPAKPPPVEDVGAAGPTVLDSTRIDTARRLSASMVSPGSAPEDDVRFRMPFEGCLWGGGGSLALVVVYICAIGRKAMPPAVVVSAFGGGDDMAAGSSPRR
eukprot:CAMPEP_0185550674 /NCGR_PEP_ID=MMETSP1381-20130426/21970_1 /TAXON_ID=298111 /ORGANISM="Pavlova sp., Strain CCMP459" /LENGTH=113 /DNA_ID=CAMNT_0028163473 /DNA_START=915 /DNA_END=1256 /DNA_ORIENTATION=+